LCWFNLDVLSSLAKDAQAETIGAQEADSLAVLGEGALAETISAQEADRLAVVALDSTRESFFF
jgi:hypothetical protein